MPYIQHVWIEEVIFRNVCFDSKSFVFISKLMTWQFRQNNIKPTPSLYFCQTYIDFVIENLLSKYYDVLDFSLQITDYLRL